ncbi:MAG: SDR family oxidoreductase [Burkholderiales bacterium]|jgi:short-subunit dehydrogenase|nr:SDR family oxidoreductase [Rhodocyclaceae bacterium]MCE2725035.1 SDR family oxidoreductase [Betaproteobacteria bacterium]MCA3021436.1 SDR family oxidoreductase [Rhodocyclaceae bacterium]MCA3052156.1 SDR family oxidoreductase [Rhodocyclaceae bacterium]MCA3057741.1 SDR family oxidoreductase [Rhodocyclaceae bacterium]
MLKIFITGASSGIGESLARHYAGQGAQLALVARRGDWLDRVAASLTPKPECYVCDVRDAKALMSAAVDFMAKHGVPNIVIANAGVSRGTLTEIEDDLPAFQDIFDINVMGMVNTFHPFVEPMKAKGGGTLVGIASVAGFRGIPGGGAYSASKAAVIRYCESLRVELRSAGVAVVTICPGYIRTPMTAVNKFKMPFLIDVDQAVIRFARAIERKTSFTVIPWSMGIAARLLRIAPNWLYDRVFQRMPRKPR